jgi:hypothetical protein
LSQPSAFAAGQPKAGQFWLFFFPALTGMVGFWATLSLNIPDFSRYAKSQRDQVLGQAMGLPTTMALYSFIGVAVTSATTIIYGKTIWDPVVLLSMFQNKAALVFAMASVALATLATNIAANVVSPANDFAHLAPRWIGFRIGGFITGIIGIVMMPWKLIADPTGYIFTWLIAYSSLLGAIGGILICDYWLLRRTRLSVDDLFSTTGRYSYDRGINWCALCAMSLAISLCIPGFVDTVGHGQVLQTTKLGTFFKDLYNYGWFVTFAVSFGLYAFFMIGSPSTRLDRREVRERGYRFEPIIAPPVEDKTIVDQPPLPISTPVVDEPGPVVNEPTRVRPRSPLFAPKADIPVEDHSVPDVAADELADEVSPAPVVLSSTPIDVSSLPLEADGTMKIKASTAEGPPPADSIEPKQTDVPDNNVVPVSQEK